METRGSPPPPPPTPQNHRLAPIVGTSVPGPVRRAGGDTAPYIQFVEDMARRLRAAACCVFFDAEGANGSSRVPRLERDNRDGEGARGSIRSTRLQRDLEGNGEIIFDAFRDGEGARGSSTTTHLERNLFDLPRHAAASINLIDVNGRGSVQGDGGSPPILHWGGMIGTAAGIHTDDVWAFAHRCRGDFSPQGKSIVSRAPSPALLPLRAKLVNRFFHPGSPHLLVTGNCSSPPRRVGASGAGLTMGESSGPPLPERHFSLPGSRCVLTGLAAWPSCNQPEPIRREIRSVPHLFQQRRFITSARGGPYCKNGRTILKRPGFLPTQAPDDAATIKHWKSEPNVDGVVYGACLDATSLLVKFNPDVYLKHHNLLVSVPILGETNGELSWKITEQGKYTIKSLIDLIATFHDMGSCIEGLAIDSLVINSAGKFELVESKVEFTVLTKDGVRNNYRSAVYLLEELIVRSMGQDMLDRVPQDIEHLFDLMDSDGYCYRYWTIQNHTSLLPLQTRSSVFLAFFDYITLRIPYVDTQLKGKVAGYIPYRKLWAVISSNNTYLVEWLKYQDKTGGRTVWGSQYQLLHNVRHVIAHKLSLLEAGMLYEADEVENMLHAHFPLLLVYLQEFFWKEKRLRKFNLEAFFMDRKVTEPWPKSESEKSL